MTKDSLATFIAYQKSYVHSTIIIPKTTELSGRTEHSATKIPWKNLMLNQKEQLINRLSMVHMHMQVINVSF